MKEIKGDMRGLYNVKEGWGRASSKTGKAFSKRKQKAQENQATQWPFHHTSLPCIDGKVKKQWKNQSSPALAFVWTQYSPNPVSKPQQFRLQFLKAAFKIDWRYIYLFICQPASHFT